MAGLLQQGMGPPQGGPQPTPSPQAGTPPQSPQGQPQGHPQGGDPRVDMDPKQGPQQRDQLVNAMLEALYGPMLEQVKRILQQQPDAPQDAIGRVVAQLMLTTWQALADKGTTVPPGVMVQAAMVAAQAVGEMAIKMGLLPEQGNAEPIEAGFMLALGQFGQATAKDMDPNQRARFRDLIQGMREAKGRAQQGGGQGRGQPPASRPRPQQQAPRGPAGPGMQGGA